MQEPQTQPPGIRENLWNVTRQEYRRQWNMMVHPVTKHPRQAIRLWGWLSLASYGFMLIAAATEDGISLRSAAAYLLAAPIMGGAAAYALLHLAHNLGGFLRGRRPKGKEPSPPGASGSPNPEAQESRTARD